MAGGRILAINEGFWYRPVLTTSEVVFVPQRDARRPSTIVYGVQMLLNNDDPYLFTTFFNDKIGQRLLWDQMRLQQNVPVDRYYRRWPRLPLELVLEEELLLTAAGKDPLRGYYLQFEGGPIQLFSQPDWYIDTDDYGAF